MSAEDQRVSAARRWLLSLAATAYGLALGISTSTLWISPSPPGRLPGFMSAVGLDGRGPLRGMVTILLLAAVTPLLLNPLLRRFAETRTKRWAFVCATIALFSALSFALIDAFEIFWVGFPAIAALAICYTRRGLAAGFSSSDLVLVPTLIALYVAISDLAPGLPFAARLSIPTIALLLVRLLISELPSKASPGSFFLLAPTGLIFEARFFGRGFPGAGVMAILLALVTPWLIAATFRTRTDWERRARSIAALIIYPLIVVAYPMTHDSSGAAGNLIVNFFEEGHSLLPAAEMIQGERPYRDIVPGHGLISDGLIDFAAMKMGASNIGDVIRFRAAITCLFPLAIYLIALAATGSAHAAMLAIFYASAVTATGTPYLREIDALHGIPWLRSMPALLSLAFALSSLRLRSKRHLAISGAILVVAVLTGIEFAFYSAVAALLAAFRFSSTWKGRLVAYRSLALGVLCMAIPVAVIFAISGFLIDSFRATLFEILPLGEAYAVGFFRFPEAFAGSRALPEALRLFFHTRTFWIVGWGVAVLVSFAALSLQPLASRRRTDPLWVLGSWVAVASISHAERLYAYYLPVLVVFFLVGTTLLWRYRPLRWAAPWATLVIILFSQPNAHLMRLSEERRQRVPAPSDLVLYEGTPRARGALYRQDNIEKFMAAKEFVDGYLRPGETFFDFGNMPILYYLLERSSPIRQYEVPFYEPESLQREVIDRLERDQSVRAALIVFPNHGETGIDGVPNPVRAPLVWQYLQQRFRPAYEKNGVVFWVRR